MWTKCYLTPESHTMLSSSWVENWRMWEANSQMGRTTCPWWLSSQLTEWPEKPQSWWLQGAHRKARTCQILSPQMLCTLLFPFNISWRFFSLHSIYCFLTLITAEYSMVWMYHNLTNPLLTDTYIVCNQTIMNIIAHNLKHMTKEK